MLEPILASDLVDHATARIRDAILDGTLAPGERLVEEQLAAQLNVSRAPVREALRLLEYDGLVTSIERRGRFVVVLSARDAWEVYTLRESLEAMAFGLVVQRAPKDVLARAETLVAEMRAASHAGDQGALWHLDVSFHRLITEASDHSRLAKTWEGMVHQIALLSRQVIATAYADLNEIANRHQALVDVLRAGKPEAAVEAIRSHIRSVEVDVVRHLEAVPIDGGSSGTDHRHAATRPVVGP